MAAAELLLAVAALRSGLAITLRAAVAVAPGGARAAASASTAEELAATTCRPDWRRRGERTIDDHATEELFLFDDNCEERQSHKT
jgi:hypothetical protein